MKFLPLTKFLLPDLHDYMYFWEKGIVKFGPKASCLKVLFFTYLLIAHLLTNDDLKLSSTGIRDSIDIYY